METLVNNSISELSFILDLLYKVKKDIPNLNKMNNNSKYAVNIKFSCFIKNIDILKHNILTILKDAKNRESNLDNDIVELVNENTETAEVINDLLPYIVYYYFNRKKTNVLEDLLDLSYP